jgi:RNA polymerase sigma-70 factor, ECF subfamily
VQNEGTRTFFKSPTAAGHSREMAEAARETIEPERAPPPSLAELFAAHGDFVWRVLTSLGVRDADVDDATQEVFITVYKRIDAWDTARVPAKAWLYSIARRVASNHRRSERRQRERTDDQAPPPEPGPALDEALDRKRTLDRLDAALAKLDDDKRTVFVLFELEDLSMNEVAEIAGCPVQTAYARLYAARREIASALRRGER